MVARDGHGGFFIADTLNDRIRHVDRHGRIRTVAGTRHRGYCGDEKVAIHACLSAPHGVEYDGHEGFFIADTFNHRIRWVDSTGRIHTVAGSGKACERSTTTCGEGGPAVRAELNLPVSARRWRGGLLITDAHSNRILQVNKDGRLLRIAGTGAEGKARGGELAVHAALRSPADAIRYQGELAIADAGNCRLIRIDTHGRVRPLAGSDSTATCKHEIASWRPAHKGAPPGPARKASLAVPGYLAVRRGTLYVADLLHNVVRAITNARIQTVAGNAAKDPGFADGPATRVARLSWPSGVAVARNRLLITDPGNNRVRSLGLP